MSTTLANRINKIKDYYTANEAGTFYWNTGNDVYFADNENGTTIGTTHSCSIGSSSYYGSGGCHAFAQYVLAIATGHYLQVATNNYSEPSGPWILYEKGSIPNVIVGDLVRINSADNGTFEVKDADGNTELDGQFQHTAIVTAVDSHGNVTLLQTTTDYCTIVNAGFCPSKLRGFG